MFEWAKTKWHFLLDLQMFQKCCFSFFFLMIFLSYRSLLIRTYAKHIKNKQYKFDRILQILKCRLYLYYILYMTLIMFYEGLHLLEKLLFLCINLHTLRNSGRIQMIFEFIRFSWMPHCLCKCLYKWFRNKSVCPAC